MESAPWSCAEGSTDAGADAGPPHGDQPVNTRKGVSVRQAALRCRHPEPSGFGGPWGCWLWGLLWIVLLRILTTPLGSGHPLQPYLCSGSWSAPTLFDLRPGHGAAAAPGTCFLGVVSISWVLPPSRRWRPRFPPPCRRRPGGLQPEPLFPLVH